MAGVVDVIGRAIAFAMLLVGHNMLFAQNPVDQDNSLMQTPTRPTAPSTESSNPGQVPPKGVTPVTPRVTLIVRDSTLRHAIYAVARQAKLRVVYDGSSHISNRRVSVRIADATILDAYQALLKGTGLEAILSPDNKTVVIRLPQRLGELSGSDSTAVIIGSVSDSTTGNRIAGVAITLIGTTFKVVTNDEGLFSIKDVPPREYTVSIRHMGYAPKTYRVRVIAGKMEGLSILLRAAPTALSEVVTTAIGLQRRVEVANDIAKVNADSLLRIAPARSVSDLLAVARIPGVEVTPSSGLPGSPSRIRLRGVGSMSRSNDPVVIVDGVWISAETSTDRVRNQSVSGSIVNNAFVGSRLDDIDPGSIETIEVLRGPSAASLYGTDAANGVIIITTKRGTIGKTRWIFNVDHSWNRTPGQYQNQYRAYGVGVRGNKEIDSCTLYDVDNLLCTIDSVTSLNPRNHALLTNEGIGSDGRYNVSVSGGTQALQYALTASQQELLGPLTLPKVDRIRFRQLGETIPGWLDRQDQQKSKNFTAQMTLLPTPALQLSLTLTGAQGSQSSGNAQFSPRDAVIAFPAEDTVLYTAVGAKNRRARTKVDRASSRVALNADWRPWSWFTPNLTLGLDRGMRNDNGVSKLRICVASICSLDSVWLSVFRGDELIYTANVRSAFPLSLGHFERFLSVKPSVGANLRRQLSSGLTTWGSQLPLGSEDFSLAGETRALPALSYNSATAGWYLDLQIGVWQRFYTTLGFRRDIGSALSGRIPPPTYPKIGMSWLVSDEGFFPDNEIVKNLRLRMSYGHSAIQPDLSDVRGGYRNAPSIVNGKIVNAIYQSVLGNFELRPERSQELEYGFEAGLLSDRTQVSLTVSQKRNRDQLVRRWVSPSSGGVLSDNEGLISSLGNATFTENISRVLNRTVEMSLNSRIIEMTGMLWVVNVSATTSLNRVEKIGKNVLPFGSADARIVEGYPLNGLWTYPIIAYNDVNNDGRLQVDELVIGDTLIYAGWMHPRYIVNYGMTVQFLDNRLTFTANVANDGPFIQRQNKYDERGRFDPTASIAEQAMAQIPQGGSFRQSVSMVRFSQASIAVTLPDRLVRRFKATAASIAVQGSNLGLWTRYRGRDPGVNSTPIGESLTDNGITLPQPRKYALSLRLNF